MSKKELITKLKSLLDDAYSLKSEKDGFVVSMVTDHELELHLPYSNDILKQMRSQFKLTDQEVVEHFKNFIISLPFNKTKK